MKASTYPVLNNRPIDQWKVTELKEELKRRKLTTRGLKEELVRRLDEAICCETEVSEEKLDDGVDDDSLPTAEYMVVESIPVVGDISGLGTESTTTTDTQLTSDAIDPLNTEDGILGVPSTVDGRSGGAPLFDLGQNEEMETVVTNTSAEVVDVLSVNLSPEASLGSRVLQTSELENEDKSSGDIQVLDGEKPLEEDEKLDLPDTTTTVQVSEVSPSVGFQVNNDSITINPPSINVKNDFKDSITADDVKLELESKPEIIEPSLVDVVPNSGESLPVDFDKPHEDKIPVERESNNVRDTEMSEINNSVEFESAEKLNLDRSSGDDSMEEDASESKQVDSTYESKEVEEKNVQSEKPAVKDEIGLDATDDKLFVEKSNSLHVEKKDGIVAAPEKRKLSVEVIEPSKRQRRWNSGKNLKGMEPKSVTVTASNTPSDMPQHSSSTSFSLSNSNTNHDTSKERIVPPPTRSPTNSLRIDRFLRPFTLKAVQDLLGKTGTVTSFWMDQIKTHCYVTYSSEEEAVKTRDALYNLQWPPNGGRLLAVEFVKPDEIKLRLEPQAPQPQAPTKLIITGPVAPTQPAKPSLASPRVAAIKRLQPPAKPVIPPPRILSNPPPARDLVSPRPDPLPEKVDSPIVTLDDLFRKTKATPRIYYLPLTDEQVASKVRNRV